MASLSFPFLGHIFIYVFLGILVCINNRANRKEKTTADCLPSEGIVIRERMSKERSHSLVLSHGCLPSRSPVTGERVPLSEITSLLLEKARMVKGASLHRLAPIWQFDIRLSANSGAVSHVVRVTRSSGQRPFLFFLHLLFLFRSPTVFCPCPVQLLTGKMALIICISIFSQLQYSYPAGDLHAANCFHELHLLSRRQGTVGQSKHRRVYS